MKTNVGITSVLRRYYVGIFALALTACTPGVDETLYGGISYRDQSAPIGVSSRFDFAQMQGRWFVRRLTPDDLEPANIFFHAPDNGKFRVSEGRGFCPEGVICETAFAEYVIEDTSTGALSLLRSGPGPDRAFIVHWVDEGYRTMAVGAANGRYAWVLDRKSAGGADRIAAALEILEFYGYDTAVMRAKTQEKLE